MHSSLAVAKYIIINHKGEFPSRKLAYLVYLAHGWKLGIYNRALTAEKVMAWPKGPAFPKLHEVTKKYRIYPVNTIYEPEEEIQQQEKKLIDFVMHLYTKRSTKVLQSMITHKNSPWYKIQYKKKLPNGRIINNNIIPNYLIRDYYRSAYLKGKTITKQDLTEEVPWD